MNKTYFRKEREIVSVLPARGEAARGWQRWTPYAAFTWSLLYGGLGIYWALGGSGFPYTPKTASDSLGPLLGRFEPVVAWTVVILAGIPAAVMGAVMLRGGPITHGERSRALRPLFIIAGALLAGILLLLMTGLDLLVKVGYLPSLILGHIPVEKSQALLAAWTQWATFHQLLCLLGGFIWLAATLSYARRSGDACLVCGRREGPEGWTSPDQAARWGRTAVYIAIVAPVFYALTRYIWAIGIPLGMNKERFLEGQASGNWVGGALFLGNFTLLGAVLMLGLVQHWGEVFPRWIPGLAGRRVPIALAVVPASLASVLLIVGGIGIWSGLGLMAANAKAAGSEGIALIEEIVIGLGPTLLFPVWGAALAVATLGYYYRRRGPCSVCGRGASGEAEKLSLSYQGE